MTSSQKFAETIGAMPECTVGELAKFVRDHPELGCMTLQDLLAHVPEPTSGQMELESRLRSELATLGVSMPPTRITEAAVERILRTDLDVIGPIVEIARAAKQLEVEISKFIIVAESLGHDDVAVAFEIGPHPQRQAMWGVIEHLNIPLTLWLRFL